MDTTWIEKEVAAVSEEVIALRRDFHKHPELGMHEERTSAIVEKYLNEIGISTKRMFKTGVVGVLESGTPGKCLLLRADMDALPIQEANDIPYRSVNDGVMHACGHDGHTAMLLCAAKILAKHREEMTGSVKFVFQPNEEDSGAAGMVQEGALETPQVDASFGLHLWSQVPDGMIGLSAGPIMAEMYNFTIDLKGVATHSSSPNNGVDAILCAADIIQQAQMIQTREIDPMLATCLNFGTIQGGAMSNIVPDHCVITGSMRYLYDGSENSPQQPLKRLERVVTKVAEAHRVKSSITFEVSNYVLCNDPELVDFVRSNVCSSLVASDQIMPFVTMAGEDFSEFSNHNGIPGVFMFIGVGDPEKGTDVPHHNEHFNIDEDMLPLGVKAHVTMAVQYLKDSI